MTNHIILSQFSSSLKPIYKNNKDDFYNLTYQYNDAINRKNGQYEDSLPFIRFKDYSTDPSRHNTALLKRAQDIQRHMPKDVLIIPCQWDEHANPGQPPAVGSNIAYIYDKKDDLPSTKANFLIAFPRYDMDMVKLYNIKNYWHDTLVGKILAKPQNDDQLTEARLRHPVDEPPRRFFSTGLTMPMHVVMHEQFMDHADTFGKFVKNEIAPPARLATWFKNARSFLTRPFAEPYDKATTFTP